MASWILGELQVELMGTFNLLTWRFTGLTVQGAKARYGELIVKVARESSWPEALQYYWDNYGFNRTIDTKEDLMYNH
jgi:hypothetical protein